MAQQEASALQRLLTVQQVADLLQVSRAAVYGLVQQGHLKPVPLPIRKTRFSERDIRAFLGEEIDDYES